ncbi:MULTISPECIES: ArnT family glycosyltransferase [unclassified Saccharicrinis]|uniref:ArnT family glycosyltransferase n=1 Tax=unclassified Saccharicrinis TaxID=2646859 RepID=UPI003D32691C
MFSYKKNTSVLLLIFIFIVLTAFNINKAFHIDDTFHLEAAQLIQQNHEKAMHGLINWYGTSSPLYSFNQPPLFFYLLAIYTNIFGFSEISLHILMSIFVLISLIAFNKIINSLNVKNKHYLLVLFGLSTPLIVNQNVMTDIPILSLILFSCYYSLVALNPDKKHYYWFSAILLSLGIMIKYSTLPFLGALGLIIILRKDYKYLLAFLIPISVILTWSFFNYFDYGSVHILDRPANSFHPKIVTSFLICIGAISPFSLAFISAYKPFKNTDNKLYAVIAIGLVWILWSLYSPIKYQLQKIVLVVLFGINGLIALSPIYSRLLMLIKTRNKNSVLSPHPDIFIYAISICTFLVLFAPFMATRHILLLLPFLLILGDPLFTHAGKAIKYISIITSVALGLALGISDWHFANFYRVVQNKLQLPMHKNIYYTGHWGWQWYANKNKLKQFDANYSKLKPGDYLIYPSQVTRYPLPDSIPKKLVLAYYEQPGIETFFYVSNAGLYASGNRNPVWCLLHTPIDTIKVYKVTEE